MVTEVVLLSRKEVMKKESFTAFSVSTPVYSTRYVRLGPLLKVGVDQEICREMDVLLCNATPRGIDGTAEVTQRAYSYDLYTVTCCTAYTFIAYCTYIAWWDFSTATTSTHNLYMTCHALTSLLCPHSRFFTKFSHSILVCCSHRCIVGRVGHETKNVIGQHHPNRYSDCFKESSTDSVKSGYSSVLHLISGQDVVMS